MNQFELFSNSSSGMVGKNATHSAGRGETFHDWFPYLEGFSSSFVKTVRRNYLPESKHILEPFAGIGTTPIYLAEEGIDCSYCEINPVLLHLIRTKASALTAEPKTRLKLAKRLEKISAQVADICKKSSIDPIAENYKPTFGSSIFFRDDNFQKIISLKNFERSLAKVEPDVASLFSVAVYSSLLESSLLKRAGDVRFRNPKELTLGIKPIELLVIKRLETICSDLMDCFVTISAPKLIDTNAKNLSNYESIQADGVITSPPYLNGTNYLRNTRLELWYLEFITARDSLRKFRDGAVTAGINDVTNGKPFEMLPEVKTVYDLVAEKAYDQRIPQMVAGYFYEMKLVLKGLKKHVRKNGKICIDIGDSIYAGVHVPTHDLLISVGNSIGLELIDQVVLRERLSHNKARLSQQLLVFQR